MATPLLYNLTVMHTLATRDVKNSYKRTRLGPWWGVVTSCVMIVTLWAVFGYLFTEEGYFGYLASGILLWGLVNGVLSAAGSIFIANESLIRSLELPAWVYIGRTLEKSFLIFLHALPLVPASILLTGGEISWEVLWFLPGLVVVVLNLIWMAGTIGIVATRFRDLGPIIASVIIVLFYMTPLFWKPDILHPTARDVFLDWNIFYYLINLLRQPWLGSAPRLEDWAIGLAFALLGWLSFMLIYRVFSHRIPFWL